MSAYRLLKAAAASAAIALCGAAFAQSDPTPLSRAEVKAQTRAAEKARQLTPAGQGPQFKVSTASNKTRAQRKAETLAARRAHALQPAGEGDIQTADRSVRAAPSTVDRAARKAETRRLEKAGQLVPAGEGPGSPRK